MSRQTLAKDIWLACDIMRRDNNCGGVMEYVEHLSWLLFLRFLDGQEDIFEAEAKIKGRTYQRILDGIYRWSHWARKDWGTGALPQFVHGELIPYLRSLSGSPERDIIRGIFADRNVIVCASEYNLRDVIQIIDVIDFQNPDDIHTVSFVYEDLLKKLGSENRLAGEFYTPRPVIRFMVEVVDPKIGETVYDPACGTCGFLVESYLRMKKLEASTRDHEKLQNETFVGQEKKPVPALLGLMNMVLHGILTADIRRRNTLEEDIREVSERFDVVLTNPPFGGKENKQVQRNFPIESQATELLFLQHIMRKLKPAGRCGVVVPGGVLFGDGACAKIKEELLEQFSLHTVVRLPKGVFAPYTNQETNLLFFERAGPTRTIWYYEHPLPPDRTSLKNPCYTKTKPLLFQEFGPLLKWWNVREANEFAWRVQLSDVAEENYNLDLRHPKHSGAQSIRTRSEVCSSIADNLSAFMSNTQEIVTLVSHSGDVSAVEKTPKYKTLPELGVQINPESRNPEGTTPHEFFKYVDLSSVSFNQFEDVKEIRGADAPSRARRVIRENDVILSTVRPYLCGHAVVPAELDGQMCSTGFAVLRCPSDLHPRFLYYMLISPNVIAQFIRFMRGAHYPALKDAHVKSILVPKITLPNQVQVVNRLDALYAAVLPLRASIEAFGQRIVSDLNGIFPAILSDIYGDVNSKD